MTNIARWNPVKAVTSFNPASTFEEMFRGLRSHPLWNEMEPSPLMRLDVSEDEKSFLVRAEIPGINKEAIEISVEGNQVAISADVKRELGQKDHGQKDVEQMYLHTERYYGRIYRAFTLPSEVDNTKADARYENGVLTLTLPKKANGTARKLRVN